MSRIFVGLSGGVDSAVSAALLQKEGHEVVGAFIKIWRPEFIECTWREDRISAMRVTAHLGIPFTEVDLSEEYKEAVIDETVAAYESGITPNPDVLCNRSIKFGAFREWALREGADYIATGHYAEVSHENGTRLFRGKDPSKDQSYFLCHVVAEDLANALFPIGHLEKSEVRSIARELNLPNAARPDSQGLCFIGGIDMKEFLSALIPMKAGTVLNVNGEPIGVHDGAALYTPGQRHGFLLRKEKKPHYVTRTDVSANTITVSIERDDACRTQIPVHHANWIGEPRSEIGAQVRYRERAHECTLTQAEGVLIATFREPVLAAPGQSIAFYNGNELLGGGIIGNVDSDVSAALAR